ncbi:MAG: hypothetical protein ACP5QK_09790 [Myxococcota bacterium]
MKSKVFIFYILCLQIFSCVGAGYNSKKLDSLHKYLSDEMKKGSIYDGFQSRAFFKVIYKSIELRKNLVEAIAEMESLTESEKGALLNKEMEEESRFFDFCVVLSTTDFKTNDLNVKNSIWRIFIEDSNGKREYPVEIKEIKADQKVKILYPGVSRFGKFYQIRFEKKDRTDIKGVSLVFSSVLGKAVFKY